MDGPIRLTFSRGEKLILTGGGFFSQRSFYVHRKVCVFVCVCVAWRSFSTLNWCVKPRMTDKSACIQAR